MDDSNILLAVKCLKDLENGVLVSSYDEDWKDKRNNFLASINNVNEVSEIHVLFEQLRKMEMCVQNKMQNKSWINNERSSWRSMTDPKHELINNVSHFIIALKLLEDNLLPRAHCHQWNDSGRDEWLQRCNSVLDPAHQLQLEQTGKDAKESQEDTNIQQAVQCVKDFFSNIPESSFDEEWKAVKEGFSTTLDGVKTISELYILFEQLKSFASHVKYCQKTDISQQWKLKYWMVITDTNLEVSYTITRFILTIKFMGEYLLDEIFSDEWKVPERKVWLKKCQSLIDPLHQLVFYKELLLKNNGVLNILGYESLQAYEEELCKVKTFISQAANELDKVNTGTGIADTTGGALSIAAGVLGGAGLLLIPFTAGVSSILFFSAIGVGVGGASTSIASLITKNIVDKKQVSQVQTETETITGTTIVLIKLKANHVNSITELRERLDSLGKTRALHYIKAFSSAPFGIKSRGETISGIVTITGQIATHSLRGNYDVAEDVLPALFRGVTPLASATAAIFSGILSVASIGLGIFTIVEGAKKIKNGSEIAKNLRELTAKFTTAEDEIHTYYEDYRNSLQEKVISLNKNL